MEICFFSCYVSTYIVSSVWALSPQSLNYLLYGPWAEKFADPAVEVSLLVRGVGPWLQGWQSEAMPDALLEAVGS